MPELSTTLHLFQPDVMRQIVCIPPDAIGKINVLPQVRKSITKAGIEELQHSIKATDGLINPITLALLSATKTKEYIDFYNRVFHANMSIEDMQALHDTHGNPFYLILIAGHRRLHAVKNLLKDHEESTAIPLHARIIENISPKEALRLQIAENTHERVPPAVEAQTVAQLCLLIIEETRQKENRIPTQTELARAVSRSTEIVRNALLFYKLPQKVKDLATDNDSKLPYGLFVELALFDKYCKENNKEFTEEAMLREVLHIQARNMTLKEIKEYFDAKKTNIGNASGDLFQGAQIGITEEELLYTIMQEVKKTLRQALIGVERLANILNNHKKDKNELRQEINDIMDMLQLYLTQLVHIFKVMNTEYVLKETLEEMLDRMLGDEDADEPSALDLDLRLSLQNLHRLICNFLQKFKFG